MLKRPISFEDFNGNQVEEVHYFNMTKAELLDLEVQYDGGFESFIQRVVEARDNKAILEEFKKLILLSYGIKSDDGRMFQKSDEIRAQFAQTAAYDALFMELATDDKAAAAFINGIMPKDISAAADQDKPQGPPPQAFAAPTPKP